MLVSVKNPGRRGVERDGPGAMIRVITYRNFGYSYSQPGGTARRLLTGGGSPAGISEL